MILILGIDMGKFFIALIGILACTGCGNNPKDPLEPYNRGIYEFNDAVDNAVIEPVSRAYDRVVADEFQEMISNFFSNLGEPVRFINDVLQLNLNGAAIDLERFVFNTTFGIFGLMDFSDGFADIPMRNQDYGMTLARWSNNAPTPFLVLPLLGPSNVRDTVGLGMTFATNNALDLQPENEAFIILGIQKRANLLKYENLMALQLDPYVAMRESYIARRNAQYQKLNNE